MTDQYRLAGSEPQPLSAWHHQVEGFVDEMHQSLGALPYDPAPRRLYCAASLYDGFQNGGFAETPDSIIYDQARHAGGPLLSPLEQLAQRLHDHGMSLAVDEFRVGKDLVGVMGGHALRRGSSGYRQAFELGRAVAKAGFCIVTGGGPGAMEAANLGALTSAMTEQQASSLVDRLAESATFKDDVDDFVGVALGVLSSVENPVQNLALPTWFYGHEPSNPFATHIAKYFSNSEREDGLLAIAKAGIVFLAGGPGTMQEVFQDAAQNAYETYGDPSPMLLLDHPETPNHWRSSGVLGVLDEVFTDSDNERRPGWDLVSEVPNIDAVVEALIRHSKPSG